MNMFRLFVYSQDWAEVCSRWEAMAPHPYLPQTLGKLNRINGILNLKLIKLSENFELYGLNFALALVAIRFTLSETHRLSPHELTMNPYPLHLKHSLLILDSIHYRLT